jgi:hypothetical protein
LKELHFTGTPPLHLLTSYGDGAEEVMHVGLQAHCSQQSSLSLVVGTLVFLPSSLRCLSLSPQLKPTDDALASLCARNLSFLEELTIMDASLITDRGLQRLSTSASLTSSLRTLRLCCAKGITNEAALHIAHFANLTTLSLACCPLSAAGIRAFAALRCLRKLNLAYSKDVTDRALKSLPRSLRSLNLTATKITDRGLQYLSMVPSSTACPSPPPLLSPSLSFSSALRFYHQLSATAIGSNTATALQGDRAVPRPANRSANFYSSHMIQSTTPQLPHLVKLKLNECFITDEGIKFLLPYLRSLTTLKLSSTFITSASGQALSSFRSLVTLEVNGCHGALLSLLRIQSCCFCLASTHPRT